MCTVKIGNSNMNDYICIKERLTIVFDNIHVCCIDGLLKAHIGF